MALYLRRLVYFAAAVALAIAFSCKTFSITDEICDPSRVDAKRMQGEPADGDCSRCLENNCCDKVGVCGNKENCTDIVKSVHACVLDANTTGKGAEAEQACATKNHLKENAEANDAYRCMRDECGRACELPVCRVDPATVLFQNAACDRCFSGACCAQLASCYGSRACKLTVECITKCTDQLQGLADGGPGNVLDGGPGSMSNAFDIEAADLCADDGGVKSVPNGPPPCVSKCLCRFKDNDQGLEPIDEDLKPFKLAFEVYNCGRGHDCLNLCARGSDDRDADVP